MCVAVPRNIAAAPSLHYVPPTMHRRARLSFATIARSLLCLALLGTAGCEDQDPAASTGGSGGSGGSGATGGSGGTGGVGGTGGSGAGPAETTGCSDDVILYATPADPAARGPWPVGARTVTVGALKTEVWYPAQLGSDAGKDPVAYDLREWLPESEKAKIPDEAAPQQPCGCHRDLPLDAAHGPYPVVLFIHGTAGFRTQSLAHMEHWASRGFVVLAADHPGLYLADALDFEFGADLPADAQSILAALPAAAGDLAFLAGHIDTTRIGLSGHSAGGGGVAGLGGEPGARVIMPLAAGGTEAGANLESTLVMGGVLDKVVAYDEQVSGFGSSPAKRRLVGVGNSGHLFPTDLCWMTNPAGQDIVTTAQMYDIKNANLAGALFDCPEGQLAREIQRDIVNFATTAVLEETLVCKPGNPFEDIQTQYPDVADYQEAL